MEIIDKAQKLMKAKGIGCWLTLTGEGRDINSFLLLGNKLYSRHAIIVPSSGKPTVIIGKMEGKTLPRKYFRVVYPKKRAHFKELLVKAISGFRTIAVNYARNILDNGEYGLNYVGYGEVSELKRLLKKTKFVSSEDIQYATRTIKTGEEIKLHERACAISEAAFETVLPKIVGMKENEVAALIEYEIKKRGGEPAFKSIVASGRNSSEPHHSVSDKVIKKGDVVLLDLGASYKGRCADISRTVSVGSPSPRVKKIYSLVKRAQLESIAAIRPGVSGGTVDAVSQKVMKQFSKNIEHSPGHPLGLEVHDIGPALSSGKSAARQTIEGGMILTVEPGLYFRDFGVRIEDDVLVTKDGCRQLTKSPMEIREV